MIERVAYLKVCEHCGRHAHVALPDGNTSRIFASKSDGRAQVDLLLAKGKIERDEATVLHVQIDETHFPEVEPFLSEVLDNINDLHDELLRVEAAAPHTIH